MTFSVPCLMSDFDHPEWAIYIYFISAAFGDIHDCQPCSRQQAG